MKRILKYYSFVIISVMTIVGFASASSLAQLISAMLFYPVFAYFFLSVVPYGSHAIEMPVVIRKKKSKKKRIKAEELILEEEPLRKMPGVQDIDKRAFIKLIGSAGLSVFMLSLFTKNAQAAFFGSVPGPGVVAIKDSSGNQIDPAEKQATDGYRIIQLDDSVPAYYGFQNKTGAWFIMKEDASGNYRYTKGASDFTNATTGWPNRAALTYDYFETIF